MASSLLDQVIAILPRLSDHDLQAVKTAIKALGANGSPGPNDEGSPILSTIVTVMRAEGLEFRSVAQLKASNSYAGFAKKAADIEAYLANSTKDRGEREAILRMGLRLLIESCREMGLPVSSGLLLRHIHRLPALIDQAFPGYYRIGALSTVVRERRHVG